MTPYSTQTSVQHAVTFPAVTQNTSFNPRVVSFNSTTRSKSGMDMIILPTGGNLSPSSLLESIVDWIDMSWIRFRKSNLWLCGRSEMRVWRNLVSFISRFKLIFGVDDFQSQRNQDSGYFTCRWNWVVLVGSPLSIVYIYIYIYVIFIDSFVNIFC